VGQASTYNYRVDLTDNGEPGAGADKYRIRLSTGYDSGEQTLAGGTSRCTEWTSKPAYGEGPLRRALCFQ